MLWNFILSIPSKSELINYLKFLTLADFNLKNSYQQCMIFERTNNMSLERGNESHHSTSKTVKVWRKGNFSIAVRDLWTGRFEQPLDSLLLSLLFLHYLIRRWSNRFTIDLHRLPASSFEVYFPLTSLSFKASPYDTFSLLVECNPFVLQIYLLSAIQFLLIAGENIN